MADKTMVDYTLKIKPYLEGVALIEPTTTATSTHAVGDRFYLNGTKVKCTVAIAVGDTIAIGTNVEKADDVETELANEAATRSAMGAKNFVALNKSPYRAQSTPNVSSISTQTEDELIFTTANGNFAQVLLFYSLPIGTYKVSCNMNSSDSYSPKVGVYLKNGNQDIRNVKITDGETKEFTITNEITHIEIACLGTEASSTAAVRTVTFRNLMIRLASDIDNTFQPYAKTNQELTAENEALANQTDDIVNILGAKNLLPYPYDGVATTLKGITSTINSDGTIVLNGTATENTSFSFFERSSLNFSLVEGNYIASCQVASGTYTGSVKHTLRATENGSGVIKIDEALGVEGKFNIPETEYIGYQITIPGGATLTNLRIKPMIRLASITDDSYAPYAKTNKQLTEESSDLTIGLANEAATRSQMGAKNLLPFTMENIKAINTNGTWNGNSYTYNGITYVVSEDGVIEVSGTNNSGTNSVFYLVITESGPQFNFKLGRYKLNGCPAGGSDPTYSWYVAKTGQYNSDMGSGATFEVTSETDSYWSLISVKTGTALEGTKTFKPMVRLASDPDATYQPYAKTNQELTAEIYEVNSALVNKASTTDVNNKHKLTIETVSTSGWTADSTSQSGTTLYKKSISLNHVYVESPAVDIATSSGTGLPTAAQQTAYDLLQYVTVDGTTLYLYASAIPATQFYIGVEGVD